MMGSTANKQQDGGAEFKTYSTTHMGEKDLTCRTGMGCISYLYLLIITWKVL